jgi:hypothetical protein
VSRTAIALERLAIVAASLALSLGLIALLSGFFAGRDPAGVAGAATSPGQAFADLGNRPLGPGQARSVYDSDPPTSGSHRAVPIARDAVAIDDDQLLQALQVGDVVVFYGTRTPPPGLPALARQIAGPFSPALAAAGQAVILAPRRGTAGLVAVAWAHMQRAESSGDPALRAFMSYWLGRGAPSADR